MTTAGLEDVVAAETAISDIDGHLGKLWYVGYDIKQLAQQSTFEETAFLLHHLDLPTQKQLVDFSDALAKDRQLHPFTVELLQTISPVASPMSMLRTIVSAESAHDPDGWEGPQNDEANLRKAIRLIARLPQMIGAYRMIRDGLDPIAPDPELTHAANLLYVLSGEKPDEADAKAMDRCLILHADHTMNASTFAARVTAATLSDIHSAMTSAIAALKGPLHGGANERVFEMLEEISEVDQVDSYIKDALGKRKKIMGFGHRVYKTEDPRATVLRELARELGERKGDTKWFEMSERVYEVVREEKGLYPNVDFYAASVYHYLGIPTALFTTVFAVSRIAGWTAHAREQYSDNRLIRPESDYTGPPPRDYTAIAARNS
ncbi:MAG: citrate/2-methylcitrate synthase [Actinomycetota bacterium]|nr:citrate synthase [Actinomycetota bacterium]